MRKHGTKAAVFLGTSLPWAFFGMYGDAELGTVALYAVMVLCLGGLWWLAAKGKCLYMAAPGTAVSVVLSHICITEFATEKWSWFLSL